MERQRSASSTAGVPDVPGEKLSITVIILTFNEEIHITRCLTLIAPLVERIVVVDSFSTDRTVEIAERLGADVYQRPFKHQAEQFQWAQENCKISTDWVLRLDADEYLEPTLIQQLRKRLASLAGDITGIDFKLKVIFKGRWIRYGGYYSTVLTRMWRTGAGQYEQRWMDEKVVLTRGRSQYIRDGDLVDENLKDIGWWTDKHNRYATRQMVDFINLEYGLFVSDNRSAWHSSGHNWLKRMLRNHVFGGSPLYWRSALYFIYRYVVRLGFLDGRRGFVWHFLQGFWFFVLIDAKIEEARDFIKEHGSRAFIEHLKTRYNVEL